MAKRWFNKRFGARALAGVLCFAMLAPMAPTQAALTGAWPVKMHVNTADPSFVDPDTGAAVVNTDGELPTITVEANGVIDESNKLTGYVEVALRIKPGVLYYQEGANPGDPRTLLDGKDAADAAIAAGETVVTEAQPFKSASVVLRYNGKLTPWEWDKRDGDGKKADPTLPGMAAQAVDMTTAVDKGPSVRGMVETPALHPTTRIGQVRVSAFSDTYEFNDGTTTITLGNKDGVEGNDGGYLYLAAEDFTAADLNGEDTVTVVARFKYELDPNDDNNNPWSTDFTKGVANPNVTDWVDLTATNAKALLRVVTQAELDAVADPVARYPVMYDSGKSETYPHGNGYYESDDPTDGRGAYDLTKTPTDPDYFKPEYNRMEEPANIHARPGANPGDPAIKDTTFVVTGRHNHTLVNKLSYDFAGGNPDDFASILFYDWDDTLIGTLVVKKDVDARERVNNFVRDNFIYTDGNNDPAGDDTNLSLQDNTTATISSLARTDSYRGKYDHAGPAPDRTTPEIADGADYPLTNKLDYVFFKRTMVNNEDKKPDPSAQVDDGHGNMIPKYPQGTADPAYVKDLATWEHTEYIQKTDDGTPTGTPDWDEEYPYIHGWALVEDYMHPENVWTTIGYAGELDDYTDYTLRGANTPQTTPAELSVSGGGTLVFADFDFSAQPAGKMYAVKAIYEPGLDLGSTNFTYRMLKKPYFNKARPESAHTIDTSTGLAVSAGGAFTAEMTFERANVDLGGTDIIGVARMRSPAVRQDTTTDLKWEWIPEKNVTNDLENADDNDAFVDRKQVTYTKVEVTNTEEITVSLTLSARQNKVNYFLIEQYGLNFVVGGERSDTDQTRAAGENVPNNYNYLTNESDTTDAYYDAKFLEREGSHGFVLYATLNSIMEKATSFHHGGTDFNTYVNNAMMADANLRHPVSKSPATSNSSSQRTQMREAIQKAAQQAEAHVGLPDEADYWDKDHGHAKLTYHQLQWFIIDYINNSATATLKDPTTAQGQKIEWCHLDEACAAASSGKPTTWADLINKADLGADGDIEKLSASEVESYFHLRKDGSGTELVTADIPDFADDVIAAVAALKGAGVALADITWDQVQYYLDQGSILTPVTGMDDYGAEHYWWYDGAKASDVTPTDWTKFENAVKAASDQNLLPATAVLPDGRHVNDRSAKLNKLESVYNDDKSTTASSQPWYDATHNLCAALPGVTDGEGVRFNTFSDFKTAVIDAWEQAHGLATPVDNPSWKQVQYHIIHKNDAGYPGFPAADTDTQPESDGYWWYDGGTKISTVDTLLKAAHKANAGDTTALDALTVADIGNFAGLQFRVGFNGTTDLVTAANFNTFKSNVMAIEAAHGQSLTWEQLQYLLIHGTGSADPTSAADRLKMANEASDYYWWKDKGDGSGTGYVPPITVTDVKTLMEAAYRSKANGNPHAWDNLTSATQLADVANSAATTSSSFRLVEACPTGAVNFSDLTAYTDAELSGTTGVKAMLENLYSAVATAGTETYDSLTWYQIQHYLITNGTYLTATDTSLPGSTVYWWKENAADPSLVAAQPEEDFGKMLNKMSDYANDMMSGGPMTFQDVLNGITDGMWNNMGFVGWDSVNFVTEAITAANKATVVDSNLLNAESGGAIGFGTYFDWGTMKVDLTWYQIQDAIINGSTVYTVNDPWTAMANVQGIGINQPSWADTYWPDGATKSTTDFIPMALEPGEEEGEVVNIMSRSEAAIDLLLREAERDPDFLEKNEEALERLFAKVDQLRTQKGGEEPPAVTESPAPMESPEATESPKPAESPDPTESPEPTESPKPETPEEPTEPTDPKPSENPEPSESPAPGESPEPAESPAPETPEEPEEPGEPTEPDDPTNNDPDPTTDPEEENGGPGGETRPTEATTPPEEPTAPNEGGGGEEDAASSTDAPGGVTLAQSFRMLKARKLLREKVPWTYGGPSSGERPRTLFRSLVSMTSLERQNTSKVGGKLS